MSAANGEYGFRLKISGAAYAAEQVNVQSLSLSPSLLMPKSAILTRP